MLTLYYCPATISLSVHILLHELGLPHQLELVNVREGEQFRPGYEAVHPFRRVPVLELDDGTRLTQVGAILTYLCESTAAEGAPSPLLAQGTLARARCQEWLSVLASHAHVAFRRLFRPHQIVPRDDVRDDLIASGRKDFAAALDWAQQHARGPYLLGEQYSIVDPYLFVMLRWAQYIEIPGQHWGELSEWQHRVGARPAVQRALHIEELRAG